MIQMFAKSVRGYGHIRENKVCQDYSSCYSDNERKIITCADGHGGRIYLRSNEGSKMACEALQEVFQSITRHQMRSMTNAEQLKKVKLNILCSWNKRVENALSCKPRVSEAKGLSADEIDLLKENPIRMYGTTLTGAMLFDNKLLVVGIGDTECLLCRRGKLLKVFDNDDDPAGNITYSMCQDDAYKYLRIAVIDWKKVDGILLCTDGLSSPYQSYANFELSFMRGMMRTIIEKKSTLYISNFINEVAEKIGVGDDVSLSFLIKDDTWKYYYK